MTERRLFFSKCPEICKSRLKVSSHHLVDVEHEMHDLTDGRDGTPELEGVSA
jgi:hypothetical protein